MERDRQSEGDQILLDLDKTENREMLGDLDKTGEQTLLNLSDTFHFENLGNKIQEQEESPGISPAKNGGLTECLSPLVVEDAGDRKEEEGGEVGGGVEKVSEVGGLGSYIQKPSTKAGEGEVRRGSSKRRRSRKRRRKRSKERKGKEEKGFDIDAEIVGVRESSVSERIK